MSLEYSLIGDKIQIKTIKQGLGELPLKYQEVYFFFICQDDNKNFLSGSQHLATRIIIGRNMFNSTLEQVIPNLQQGQRVHVLSIEDEKQVQYEIEIIRFGRVCNLPWQLQGEELYNSSLNLKQKATELFKQQKFDIASSNYQSAQRLINNDYGPKQKELSGQLISNISLCALKLQDWEKCVSEASKVLLDEPQNVKLLHRRAVAYIELAEFEKAKIDLLQAQKIDPQNNEVLKEIDGLANKEKKIKQKQSAIYKKMLFGS